MPAFAALIPLLAKMGAGAAATGVASGGAGAALGGAGAAAGGGGFLASMLPFLKQAGTQYAKGSLMGLMNGQGQQQQPQQNQFYQPQQQMYPPTADLGSLLQAYNRPRTPRGYY